MSRIKMEILLLLFLRTKEEDDVAKKSNKYTRSLSIRLYPCNIAMYGCFQALITVIYIQAHMYVHTFI